MIITCILLTGVCIFFLYYFFLAHHVHEELPAPPPSPPFHTSLNKEQKKHKCKTSKKRKFTCEFQGRLGNNLFQLATTYAVARLCGDAEFAFLPSQLSATTSPYCQLWNKSSNVTILNDKPKKTFTSPDENEYSCCNYPSLTPSKTKTNSALQTKQYGEEEEEDVHFVGFFHYEPLIRPFVREWAKSVLNLNPRDYLSRTEIDQVRNTYMLHFRLTDFCTDSAFILPLDDFYTRAFQLVLAKDPTATFSVFSDEPLKARQVLTRLHKHLRVQWIDETNPVKSFILMIQCRKGSISPHSTYSWWASYLNDNPDKLAIIPRRWQVKDVDFSGMHAPCFTLL